MAETPSRAGADFNSGARLMPFEWTEDRKARVKQMVSEGECYSVIARELGCKTRNQISGIVMRMRDGGEFDGAAKFPKPAGGKRERKCPGLAFVPAIRDLHSKGHSDREIAQQVGIRPDDVRYVRRINRMPAVTRKEVAPRYAEQLRFLVLSGKSDGEIAVELNITPYQARYERRRQKIRPAPKPPKVAPQIVKGDDGEKVRKVFAEGFMGQRSRVGLADLAKTGMCRFPIDQVRGPVRFCGDETTEGAVYCAHHASRCYTTAPGPKPGKLKLAPFGMRFEKRKAC